MKVPIVICDDSALAQKMLVRSLPSDWDIDVTFASNGLDALQALREGHARFMFLDLNMPILDGYETLEAMCEQGLTTKVIVVSGDVQPQAYQRVTRLGAIAYIKKPVNPVQIKEILREHGAYDESTRTMATSSTPQNTLDIKVGFLESCQEVANIAVGQAADLLARLMNVFVIMPIPKVNMLDYGELRMALESGIDSENANSAICQGFSGAKISGEALLMIYQSNTKDIAKLLKYSGELTESAELELRMDISNVLIGACLRGLAQQLDTEFSQSHPVVLGKHLPLSRLVTSESPRWKQTLAMEVNFRIEGHDLTCDLLLLFTQDSVKQLRTRLSYIS